MLPLSEMLNIVIARFGYTELSFNSFAALNRYGRDNGYQTYSSVPHIYAKCGCFYQWEKSDIGQIISGVITIG